MRVSVLIAAVLVASVAAPGASHAEKVTTNQSTRIYAKPGEQEKVVAKVKSGQSMTVLSKDGRWIKVRFSGRTGYVPRSKLDMPDDDEIERNTRRRPFVDGRSTKRGFGGEQAPDDRIGADATETSGDGGEDTGHESGDGGDDEPKAKAKERTKIVDEDEETPIKAKSSKHTKDEPPAEDEDDDRQRGHVGAKTVIYNEADKASGESFTARPGDVLFVGDKKGRYTYVETEAGDVGYVLTSKLELRGDSGRGGQRTRQLDLRARVGVTFLQQAMRTSGGANEWPDNYNVGSSSFDLALGAAYVTPFKKDYYLGAELAYDFAKAIPGVKFDPDKAAGPMPSSTTGFSLHNFNLRALAGYDFHSRSGMALFGRLGYHYTSFTVADYIDLTKNTARLPQETLGAPTLGAALVIPRLSSSLGLRVGLDAILFGASVTQTKNLEDGAKPSAKGATMSAAVNYAWRPAMDIQVTYDLNYTSLSFGAPVAGSMRGHTGTSVARTDITHTFAVGIAKAF